MLAPPPGFPEIPAALHEFEGPVVTVSHMTSGAPASGQWVATPREGCSLMACTYTWPTDGTHDVDTASRSHRHVRACGTQSPKGQRTSPLRPSAADPPLGVAQWDLANPHLLSHLLLLTYYGVAGFDAKTRTLAPSARSR